MSTHLEDLFSEYYEWLGYLTRRNVLVGKRDKGGWSMELDIVAWNPMTNDLLHLEPSTDAYSWAKRTERYRKKFEAGQKYIYKDVMPWLAPKKAPLNQVAVFISAGADRREICGGSVRTVDEYMAEIRERVRAQGVMGKGAIPEQYPLLRTIQLTVSGYYRVVNRDGASDSNGLKV